MSASALSARTGRFELLRQDPRLLISVVVGVVLIALMVPPLCILVQDSLTITNAAGDITGWTFRHFAKLVSDRNALLSFWNTVAFATGSTVLSLILGGVLAWLVERTNAPFKILAYLATIISMGTPYILHVIAWLFLLGKIGPLNETYRYLTGSSTSLFNVNSMT